MVGLSLLFGIFVSNSGVGVFSGYCFAYIYYNVYQLDECDEKICSWRGPLEGFSMDIGGGGALLLQWEGE